MIGRIVARSVLIFILLFALTLPFPLHFFPSFGIYAADFFQPLNAFTAEFIFGFDSNYIASNESDSLGLYIHCFHIFILSAIAGLCWNFWFHRFSDTEIRYFIQVAAGFILSFFLFKYGVDKIFKVQFYSPEPNTLFTPLGLLSKDILYWSTVGSSYSYTVFSGFIEIVPAILLWSKKTRLLGALLAFGVLLHVLLINFSFDISVKILSSFLLGLSLILIQPYASSLASIFVGGSSQFKRPEFETILLKKNALFSLFRSGVIAAILFESLYFFAANGIYNDDLEDRPKYHGAYTVEVADSNAVTQLKSQLLGNLRDVKRIFVHRRGYLIFQFTDERLKDFPVSFHPQTDSWIIQTENTSIELFIRWNAHHQTYTFSWTEQRMDKQRTITQHFKLSTRAIDLKKMPLLMPQFHWHVSSPAN